MTLWGVLFAMSLGANVLLGFMAIRASVSMDVMRASLDEAVRLAQRWQSIANSWRRAAEGEPRFSLEPNLWQADDITPPSLLSAMRKMH